MQSSPPWILETPFAFSSWSSGALAIPRITVFLQTRFSVFYLHVPWARRWGQCLAVPLLCPVGPWRSSATPHPFLPDILHVHHRFGHVSEPTIALTSVPLCSEGTTQLAWWQDSRLHSPLLAPGPLYFLAVSNSHHFRRALARTPQCIISVPSGQHSPLRYSLPSSSDRLPFGLRHMDGQAQLGKPQKHADMCQ